MNQLIFSEEAYKKLVFDIAKNYSRYMTPKTWLDDHGSFADLFIRSRILPKARLEFSLPNADSSYDFENAVNIHKCLELTPVQASDPRLWARISHVEAWYYMQRRWPVDDSKKPLYVRQRYFVAGTDSRAIIRNGIARLWWSAEITKTRGATKDPYRLTRVLLSKLDITQQLLERSYGRSRKTVQAVLRFFEENAEDCLVDGQSSRDRVRYLAKQLSLRGGIAILDKIPDSSIHEFLGETLKRFNKSQKS